MKFLTPFIILISLQAVGQSNKPIPYNWRYIYIFSKEAKSISLGTKAVIKEIGKKFEGEEEQAELVRLYRESFDFKIVDKAMLSRLIDSLEQFGVNDKIRQSATIAKAFVLQRFLGKPIRDFNFPDKNGNPILLSSLRDKFVVIELWTTWCSPCIKEMVNVPQLRKMNPAIEFYSISLDNASYKMKRFVQKKQYDWPIVFGGDDKSNKELHDYLNIVAIPKYYTIDRNGIVIDVADKIDEKFLNSLK